MLALVRRTHRPVNRFRRLASLLETDLNWSGIGV